MQDLIADAIQLNLKPCGPEAFSFRPTTSYSTVATNTQSNTDIPINSSSGGISYG